MHQLIVIFTHGFAGGFSAWPIFPWHVSQGIFPNTT
jgi:hypothetical protein